MALVDVDDQWRPSLAPIRTTALSSACTLPSAAETYHTEKEQPCCLGGFGDCKKKQPLPAKASAACTASPTSNRPSNPSCCHLQHSPFDFLHSKCFPCLRPSQASTSPRSRQCRCLPGRIRRKRYLLRSWTFLLPAGGRMQSFYSSTPPAKALFSGSFHRSPSGKIEHFMSPSTSFVLTSLTTQLSGRSSQFSSPRTPASSKVQHFSGVLPSPRTPYGPSLVASPSTRHKRTNFTLAMPPGTMNRKNAIEEIIDEPSSPHVTCIGRVKEKTHCKKILLSDTVDFCTQRHRLETRAQKKEIGSLRKEKKISSDALSKHTSTMQPTESVVIEETTTLEACIQRFGRNKLLDLRQIQSHRQETCSSTYNNVLFDADCDTATPDKEAASVHKSHAKVNDDPFCTSVESSNSAAASDQKTQRCDRGLHDEDEEDNDGSGVKLQRAEAHHEAENCLPLMRRTRSRKFSEAEICVRRSPSINDTGVRQAPKHTSAVHPH